jgi:cytochrome b561
MTDRTTFDTATRIAAGDDGTNYDNVAIALHWATAFLVVANFILAEIWDYFAKPAQHLLQATHMSFGILLGAVIIARLGWRQMPGHQVSSLEIGWMRATSTAAHYLLYVLLIVEVGLGVATQWVKGRPLSFFGLGIPSPLAALARPDRQQVQEVHNWVAWTIIIVAAGHALAALYHHYALRDRVLGRMFPPARRSERTT